MDERPQLASAIVCGTFFVQMLVPVAVALLVINGIFEYLDGGLRRAALQVGKHIVPTPILHSTTDKLSDILLFMSLVWGGWVGWWLGAMASIATVAVSLFGWWGQQQRGLQREDCLFDRSDRLFILLVLCPFSQYTQVVLVTVIMNLVTIAQRTTRRKR